MKSEFKTKFLQHLIQKKEDKGFTLIELLVVIIIIGILSAIALPSFLNQANKAKQSEARTYVGSINKGQQAFFAEKGKFGSDIQDLGIGITVSSVNYKYTTAVGGAGTSTTATTKADLQTGVTGLRTYAGMVSLQRGGATSDLTSVAVLCEQKEPGVAPADPTNGSTCAGTQQRVGE
jgi:type IV pilus assembly protein PilA